MGTVSSMQIKLKRGPDSTEIWKTVDELRRSYKVSVTMNMSSIEITISPYPHPDDMDKIKSLCLKYRV
jgi:hypothetical protein